MATFTVCMIVKNEENVLRRCLDSLKGVYDELVIVDTGSSDNTKSIAKEYTDNLYDFEWIDDFSAARNYAFSNCNMDYIYTADADEVLDDENRDKLLKLKSVIDPEIEIVQMYYDNQLEHGTVYNFNKEYRPKLYKRVRSFVFVEPVHEMVRLEPLVFDSDIAIMHLPEDLHSKRDFRIYKKTIKEKGGLSARLRKMYARELYVSGEDEDILEALDYFKAVLANEELDETEIKQAESVIVKGARIKGDIKTLMTMAVHNVADGKASSEVCYELGLFYQAEGDYDEACLWFYNAAYETEAELSIHAKTDWPLMAMADCMKAVGNNEGYENYLKLANEAKANAVDIDS
ncbi:MAG: glycosyltransferase family 2 protein [Lachnospiraceae bacterium]|nr:glycosyltransferase family 2 protein [Lachnospiraceae bacterium]